MMDDDDMDIGSVLADQLDRLFDKQVSRQTIDAAEAGTLSAALWTAVEDLGVASALDPDGGGLAWSDVAPAWRVLGFHAAPLPLGETMIGRWALAVAGIERPDGPLALAAEAEGPGAVVWGTQADHVVVTTQAGKDGGGAEIRLYRSGDLRPTPVTTIGRLPCARLDLKAATPVAAAALPSAIDSLGLLPQIAVLRAVQMGGALERALALCVDYANTRVQFGTPIGKRQAVQQLIAGLAEQSAATRVAGAFGCRGLDRGDGDFAAAAAKIQAGQSATAGAAIAHQVFGAIGVTDEHMLHVFTRRLWQWRDEGETEHWWAERLGRQVVRAGGAAVWADLISH
jgi:acyl-CoA dehydrogenase